MMNGALELLSAECNSQHSLPGEEALGNPDASGAVQARRATDPFPRGRPATRAGGAVTRVSRLCVRGAPTASAAFCHLKPVSKRHLKTFADVRTCLYVDARPERGGRGPRGERVCRKGRR